MIYFLECISQLSFFPLLINTVIDLVEVFQGLLILINFIYFILFFVLLTYSLYNQIT